MHQRIRGRSATRNASTGDGVECFFLDVRIGHYFFTPDSPKSRIPRLPPAKASLGDACPRDQAAIIREVLNSHPPDTDLWESRTQALHDELEVTADRLENTAVVRSHLPKITSMAVEQAIDQAEKLVETSGTTSAVDRIHTMLHGYLRAICDDAGIAYQDKELMSGLFSRIRREHSAFASLGARKDDNEKTFRAMSAIMDAMNLIRNKQTKVSGVIDWRVRLCYSAQMPRPKRADEAYCLYHALNRGNAKSDIFKKDADFHAFERILAEGLERYPCQILAYQLMGNHWHFVLRPTEDGGMSNFLRWVTLTHTQRYHAHYGSSGEGHVYQGRFKSFPIQDDEHFFVVARYVERNALRANLVDRAEQWRWGSLYRWLSTPEPDPRLLSAWPLARWPNWVNRVNEPLTQKELDAVRWCIKRGSPFGNETWVESIARRLGLESTLRPRGRPRVRNLPNKDS